MILCKKCVYLYLCVLQERDSAVTLLKSYMVDCVLGTMFLGAWNTRLLPQHPVCARPPQFLQLLLVWAGGADVSGPTVSLVAFWLSGPVPL